MPANKLLLVVTGGVFLWVAVPPAAAHDPVTTKLTWSRDISRIVYKHCVTCHRPGGSTPMALLDYAEARPWAKAIKEEVLERRMPPAAAMQGFGEFRDSGSLSQEDIHLLADWVEGGAPEGDPAFLPPKPKPAPHSTVSARTPLPARLNAPMSLHAIRLEGLHEGGSLQVVALTPTGVVAPLLWVYNYRDKYNRNRTYLYRNPVHLPAGTRIVARPAAAAARIFIRPDAVPEP
ncbi:MAG: cytochrome c [Bryobacteraceae bacterium]